MAIGDSAGILFKIKADASQADRELKGFTSKLLGLSDGGDKALNKLSGAAVPVAAAFAVVGAAVIGAATAIFSLTKAVSEAGSEIFDASQKTGLSAESLSALKYAADQSGSSLDAITGSVAKFNVLLGEAHNGSEKAAATLEQYKITTTDTNAALEQAILTIFNLKDADLQAAAAKDLFKDRTAAILPVIKSFKGDLPGLIAQLKAMGLTMSDANVKAADEFGDALKDLEKQAGALGKEFAMELMPAMTGAMAQISQFMVANQGVATQWARTTMDAARGVGVAYQGLEQVVKAALFSINLIMMATTGQVVSSASVMRGAIEMLITPLFMLIQLGRMFGSAGGGVTDSVNATVGAITSRLDSIGGTPMPKAPKLGGGGGGGGKGGGGGGGADTARQDAVQAAKTEMQDRLQVLRAGAAEELAALDLKLAQKKTSEMEYVRDVGSIHRNALLDEMQLNEKLLENNKLNAKEKKEIRQRIRILDKEITTENIKNGTAIIEQDNKEKEALAKLEEEKEKAAKKELERLEKISGARQKAFLKYQQEELQKKIDAQNQGRQENEDILGRSILTDFSVIDGMDVRVTDFTNSLQTLGAIGGAAVQSLADGVGSLVQEWVLMGSVGPNAMKKMVASVLAGVAAQAAVLAVMELAYGIAALTPWGFAIYGSPAAHFKAAALFAGVAAVAGGAGRAIAGNSFSGAAAGGAGGGGGADSDSEAGNKPGLVFRELFNGFNQQQASRDDRLNLMLGAVTDTVGELGNKIKGMNPCDVVAIGAEGASEAIFSATQKVMQENPWAPTEHRRNQGDYR